MVSSFLNGIVVLLAETTLGFTNHFCLFFYLPSVYVLISSKGNKCLFVMHVDFVEIFVVLWRWLNHLKQKRWNVRKNMSIHMTMTLLPNWIPFVHNNQVSWIIIYFINSNNNLCLKDKTISVISYLFPLL